LRLGRVNYLVGDDLTASRGHKGLPWKIPLPGWKITAPHDKLGSPRWKMALQPF